MNTEIKITGSLEYGAYMAEYIEPEHVEVRVISKVFFLIGIIFSIGIS